MSNPYVNYYSQQGSGLSGYEGLRLQKGSGYFGKLFSTTLLPMLKWAGRNLLATGANVAEDLISGDNIKESIKRRTIEQGKEMGATAIKRARGQIGMGRKRRRKAVKSKVVIKKKAKRRRTKKKKVYKRAPKFVF